MTTEAFERVSFAKVELFYSLGVWESCELEREGRKATVTHVDRFYSCNSIPRIGINQLWDNFQVLVGYCETGKKKKRE